MSQVVRRKTRSRKTSLALDISPADVEKQSSVTDSANQSSSMSSERDEKDSMECDKKALVIDDIIDNFDLDDELKIDENTPVNVNRIEVSSNNGKSVELMDEKEQDSDSYVDIDEEEEELDEEIIDDEEYVQPTTNIKGPKKTSSVKQTEVRYGKLWEFIRDLLKNEKYNPRIITWENIEKGEFRIVDSQLVAKLWATVKRNKKMNYEKLSRAMRYYYKQNIFGIVENKRLVYRFGSKAKNWKPGVPPTGSSPPDRRCYNCLRVLESGATLKRHSEICSTNIIIPGKDSKAGIQVVQVQPKARSQPEENKKRLSQKLNEIKAKEKEDEHYEKISKEFIKTIKSKEGEKRKIEKDTLIPAKEDRKSLLEDIKSKSKIEKEALETLMNLGKQQSAVRSEASAPPSSDPVREVSSTKPSTNMYLPSTPTSNQLLSNPADKILFLKSASEKKRSQTILQKRVENLSPSTNAVMTNPANRDKPDSDDEVEIVDVVKPNDRIEAAAELVVKNQRLTTQKKSVSHSESSVRKSPSPTKVVTNVGKALNVIQSNPASPILFAEGKLPARGKSIKINPKYSNLIPRKLTTVSSPVPASAPVEQSSVSPAKPLEPQPSAGEKLLSSPTVLTPPTTAGAPAKPSLVTTVGKKDTPVEEKKPAEKEAVVSDPVKKLIRINPKYSNFVAGKRPEDCVNIASESSESADNVGRSSIKINPKYQKTSPILPAALDLSANSVEKGPPPTYEMAVSSNNLKTAKPLPPVGSSSLQEVSKVAMPDAGAPYPPSDKSPTLTTLLRNTKISEIRAKRVSPERLEESHSVRTNILKRKLSDPVSGQGGGLDLGEPIPNLWKFIRALLHNPNYNPKLVAWENLEEGIFRIHNLQDFYNVWKLMKSTTINYELWVKTVKVYDERGYMHSLEGHRCVYKFGVMATLWKPTRGEVIMAGTRHFPNQATWSMSRFYNEFNPPQSTKPGPGTLDPNGGVTTLFTLRPLDTTMTSMSEMKVMSDNSSIVIPNDGRKNIIYSGPKSPVKRVKVSHLKDPEGKSDKNGEERVVDRVKPQPHTPQKNEIPHSLELDCKLTLPTSPQQSAFLKFPNGVLLQLDRSLFADVEKKIRDVNSASAQQMKATLMPKSDIVNNDDEKTKYHRESKILQALINQENPVTSEQLREAVVPKPLKFLKESAKKLPIILPKPAPKPPEEKLSGKETPLYTSSQNPLTIEIPVPALLPTTLEDQTPPPEPGPLVVEIDDDHTTGDTGLGETNKQEDSVDSSDSENNEEGSYADDEAETQYIDDEAGEGRDTVRRENVVRCKLYRDNKKKEQKNSEKELSDLECKHKQLKVREEILDKSIEALHKYYINLISKNSFECPCEDEEGEMAVKS